MVALGGGQATLGSGHHDERNGSSWSGVNPGGKPMDTDLAAHRVSCCE
jgi:hypothetical protein